MLLALAVWMAGCVVMMADAVQVEVDVYSGRPNPRWTLSGDASAEVMRRLRALAREDGRAAQPDGLGYRGMLVHVNPAPPDLCATIRVAAGFACCEPSSTARDSGDASRSSASVCRRDVNRDVERWLIASGDRELDAALRETLKRALEP